MSAFHVRVATWLSPATAWHAVTDWSAHSRHIPLTRVEVTRSAGGLGDEFVGITRIGPVVVRDPMVVTGWVPVGPGGTGTCEITKTGCRVLGGARIIVSARPQGSYVDWYEEIRLAPPVLDTLARPGVGTAGRFVFTRAVRGLLADAEREAAATGE